MTELLKFLGEHREFLWLGLTAGVLGVLLHTVLFREVILLGGKLLALEVVYDARMRSRSFENSCRIYERFHNRFWVRLLGLAQSLVITGLSLTGLVQL